MHRLLRTGLVLPLVCAGARAQSLQILPLPHGTNSFQIMLVSPPGKEPVALQWKISIPEGVTIQPADITPGGAPKDAGKSVTCAVTGPKKASGVVACILAGSQRPIPDGSLAVVPFAMRPALSSATIRIGEILGVSRDLKPVKIGPVEAAIRGK